MNYETKQLIDSLYVRRAQLKRDLGLVELNLEILEKLDEIGELAKIQELAKKVESFKKKFNQHNNTPSTQAGPSSPPLAVPKEAPLKRAPNMKSVPFHEARAFVRTLGLKNQQDWDNYVAGKNLLLCKRPSGIPKHPYQVYYRHPDWKGMKAFLSLEEVVSISEPSKKEEENFNPDPNSEIKNPADLASASPPTMDIIPGEDYISDSSIGEIV